MGRLQMVWILSLALSIPAIIAHIASDINGVLEDNPIRQITDGPADGLDDRPGVVDDLRRGLFNAEAHFAHFVKKFDKKYSGPEEHAHRFSIFKANLRKALTHQKMDRSAIHGITKFSDLTEEEFQHHYLGLKGPSFCDPSEPDECDSGCNGGLMTTAYQYALKAGGLQKEEDYPYTGVDGTCKFDKTKVAAKVANFSTVSVDEDQIAANLVKNGPLAVGINAVFMQTYVGGVSCPFICSKLRLDHGVLLVGYGSAGYAASRMKEKPYWIIKNSWGSNWGEGGYYKLCRGHNVCGINNMVSTVAAANIHHEE